VLRLARTVQRETGNDYLCLAGGVALNCVANGRLLREGPSVKWRQPAVRHCVSQAILVPVTILRGYSNVGSVEGTWPIYG
jgi:predicted NodU family carbamoyl transferase